MRVSILAALALASLLAACAAAGTKFQTDDRRSGHFGTGMHAGRTAGR